jgi:hypothetical protein
MSNDTFAQSGRAASPPNEAEYNAVYAAVTATERGRWFLAEFANRNRKADTDLILAAIARIDEAVRAGATPQAAVAREVALNAAPAAILPVPPRGGERDEDDAVAAVIASAAPIEPPHDAPQVPLPVELQDSLQVVQSDTQQQAPAQADKDADDDYSDAIAAIAASLTTRLEEGANNPVEDTADPVREAELPLQRRASHGVSQDNSPRWHIDSPDFVFGAAALDAGIVTAGSQPETPQLQSQRLGAEIMSEQTVPPGAARQEVRPDARHESPSRLTAVEAAVVDTIVEAAMEVRPMPVAAEPATPAAQPAVSPPAVSASVLDVVPLGEVSRPQLRIAREAMPVNQHPPRFGSLTVTDALSEDEVIALFG